MTNLLHVVDIENDIRNGVETDFFFFYGHTPKIEGVVDKSCLSQWYPATFSHDDVVYRTAEHWMMAKKATLFKDSITLRKILDSSTPQAAKKLGREVKNFNLRKWSVVSPNVVLRGNRLKFAQHPELAKFLISTYPKVIVEASPYDKIWGNGLIATHKHAKVPSKWLGLNILGFVLMQVRKELLDHMDR